MDKYRGLPKYKVEWLVPETQRRPRKGWPDTRTLKAEQRRVVVIPASKPRVRPAPSARNVEMLRLYRVEGRALAEIGKRYGVSRQRVQQIVASLEKSAD